MESFSRAFPVIEKVAPRIEIHQLLDGEYTNTPHGSCFVATKHFDATCHHGEIRVGDIDQLKPELFAIIGKDRRLSAMELGSTVFFDTETTGLSSGTGTHIFLAGFGYFENNGFTIKQFFLRDFNEELAFLQTVDDFLKKFQTIVTYNGKAFDWPLLQTRFIYTRMSPRLRDPLHLDMVYTARRIWKNRLGDCSLQNIEREILGIYRTDDVPGHLIPGIYFQYLRDKNIEPLLRIFHHNMLDILSLRSLVTQAANIFADPLRSTGDPTDLFSVAHVFDSMKAWSKSTVIYQKLLSSTTDVHFKKEVISKLAWCYKRLRMWPEAEALWNHSTALNPLDIKACVELAKYYEHRCCDYQLAAEIVKKALNTIEIIRELREHQGADHRTDELKHRLERIMKKYDVQQMKDVI